MRASIYQTLTGLLLQCDAIITPIPQNPVTNYDPPLNGNVELTELRMRLRTNYKYSLIENCSTTFLIYAQIFSNFGLMQLNENAHFAEGSASIAKYCSLCLKIKTIVYNSLFDLSEGSTHRVIHYICYQSY